MNNTRDEWPEPKFVFVDDLRKKKQDQVYEMTLDELCHRHDVTKEEWLNYLIKNGLTTREHLISLGYNFAEDGTIIFP